ncbi:MAG: T9SS type A sorting domain-containing protein [Lishizhenia sp.]
MKDCYYFEWLFEYDYQRYLLLAFNIDYVVMNTFLDTNTVDTINCIYRDFYTALDTDTIELLPQFASTSTDEGLALQIYPNPTTDFINVKTENATLIENIEIKAVDGTTVLTQKETENIPISHLAAGVYFIHVRYDNALVTKRFVKE